MSSWSSADRLGVHPNNIAVRGSTKVGFSISPKPDKIWMAMRPNSDLDRAIVDPDYYHFFGREIRVCERRMGGRLFRGSEHRKSVALSRVARPVSTTAARRCGSKGPRGGREA